jgi:hypothetical protein
MFGRWTGLAGGVALMALSLLSLDCKVHCAMTAAGVPRCSACQLNAEYDDETGLCACVQGYFPFDGACVTAEAASKSCGPGYEFQGGGCVQHHCAKNEVVNSQGQCIVRQDQQLAKAQGIELKKDEAVGCPKNFVMISNDSGSDVACVPIEMTCGKGTKWNGQTCAVVTCPAGSVVDAAGQCQAISQGNEIHVKDKLTIAINTSVCSELAKHPASFGVNPGQSRVLRVSVSVDIPNQEVSMMTVREYHVFDMANNSELTVQTFAEGHGIVEKSISDHVISGLKALGGRSSELMTTGEGVCTIRREAVVIVKSYVM